MSALTVATSTRYSAIHSWRLLFGMLVACFVLLFPAREANAMSPLEALDKVCKEVESLCGSYNSFKAVAAGCFDESDELKCAVAIIGAASGGKVSEATKQIDAIVQCVQDGLPIGGACKQYLDAAGVPANKINEAYGVVNTCAKVASASGAAAEIDAVIICADTILDSAIAKEANLGIPVWVDSLFDIYGDIKHKDYWSLVYHVGATVVCLVAEYFAGGTDICGFLGELYDAGKEVVETVGDVSNGKTPDWVPAPIKDALNNARKSCDSTMPTAKYYELYFAPAIDTVVAPMQKNQDNYTAVVKPKWDTCKSYYYNRSLTSNWVCTNGEAVATEYCDRIRDQMFQPALMRRYFKLEFVDRYLKRATESIGKVQQQLPADTPNMRTPLIKALGLRVSNYKTGEIDYGVQGSTIVAISESYVREPYFKAVAKGTHKTGVTYYDFPLDIDGAVAEQTATATAKLLGNVQSVLASLKQSGCKVENKKIICDTLASIAACDAIFQTGTAADNPCVGQTGTAAQVEMIRWHKEKRFQTEKLACSYDILWNATAVGCEDPDYVKQCTALLQKEFGNKAKGFPKAGVMDCQLKRTAEQKKWAEAMPQVAQVLSPGFDLKFDLNTPPKAKPTKLPECKVSTKDALVASCPKPAAAVGSPAYKLAEQLIGVGRVRECAETEHSGTHWVPTPCIHYYQPPISLADVKDAPGQQIVSNLANTGAVGRAEKLGVTSAAEAAATMACQPFLGRADEQLCPNVAGFNACKTLVDNVKMKTCHLAGTQNIYPVAKENTAAPSVPAACKPFLGRVDEMLCSDTAAYAACKAQVDGGTIKTCRMTGSQVVYAKLAPAMPPVVPPEAPACKPFLGRADEMLCSDATAYAACKVQVDSGTMKTCRMTGSQAVYTNPPPATPPVLPPSAQACKPFLGRTDEMLCPDVTTFSACKAQVDNGQMKTCRQTGSQQVYSKPITTGLAGGSVPSGGTPTSGTGLKLGGVGLSPPVAATPKVDQAALRLCKAFLGRKDEMLCSEAPSFAACKTAVDAGQMKTCRLANTQEIYPKR